MKITMTQCDNPGCKNTGTPECEKPYIPPYGWLRLKGDWVGCGPSINITVCSVECAAPAIQASER